jgi:uncharacterized RDD family membrane protein YckC
MEDFRLDTPEAVGIAYQIAGIGTRFIAAIVDSLVWLALQIAIALGAFGVAQFGGAAQNVAQILGVTLSFVLFFGYFIIFETLWAGQTPGKRWLKIRVIKTNGYPIGFIEAVIRNLVRIADFLPIFYGLGILSMFISRQARRLGDFAAGTIVVKERGPFALQDLDVARMPELSAASRRPALGEVDPEELEWNLRALSENDLQVVRDFLDRADSLQLAVRDRIGNEIAAQVAARIGARRPYHPVLFLQRVVYLHETS